MRIIDQVKRSKNVLEKNPPANVQRVLNTPEGQA